MHLLKRLWLIPFKIFLFPGIDTSDTDEIYVNQKKFNFEVQNFENPGKRYPKTLPEIATEKFDNT